MIVILMGAPGIGKTTLIKELGERLGVPYLELSWMPEFRQMNGVQLTYEEDERIAVENLILIAQNYIRHGHKIVILSDFRMESMQQLAELIPQKSRLFLILTSTDHSELKKRIMSENRTSGFRDWEQALNINKSLQSTSPSIGEKIDVTGLSILETIDILQSKIIGYLHNPGESEQ